jgi:hypothetical protein
MRRLFLALLVILTLGVGANAQTFRGAINGTVTDPSGSSVPNAQVKATETATGIDHTTVTTSEGQFSFQDIALGTYKVSVVAQGFPTYTVDKVEVTAGTIYTLNIKLTLQTTTTMVEVSAAALTLDTSTQTQTMTLSEDIVQDIPLNGRDFTQLISVEPGFGGYNVGGFGSLNGTRPNQINWQIDGVDNNDFWHNIPAVNQGGVSGIAGVVLPIDSVTEFSAQTSSGPEGGRNAGGTVNVVTKSGTNEIHGSVYYYWRNEYLASPSPFFTPCTLGAAACLAAGQLTKAPRERNENYGLSAGGPIIKNKTFIFASYEKQDFVFGLSGLATEPSAAWVANAGALLAANNVPVSLASCNVLGPLTSQLPASRIPTGCKTAGPGFWPTSGNNSILNLPANTLNFFSPSAEFGYSYNGVARLDQQISDKHHLYLRAYMGQGNQVAPLGGSPALGTASSNLSYYFEVAPIHVYNYSAVLNSTLTSKLTNQLLFGANYFNQIFNDNNNSFVTKSLGLFLSPDATINGKPINGAPNLRIKGFEQTGLTPPEGRSDLTWQITDIVSYSSGKHQFRYGAEVRRAKLNEFYHRRGTGRFVFDGTQGPWSSSATCTGATANGPLCALADFLAGDVAGGPLDPDVTGSTIAVGNPERFVHVNAFNAYFQDSWQITKKLNFNYGLRYEYFGPVQSDKSGDIANFIPGKGFVVQGVNGVSLFDPGKNHFAPRLGVAYQPTGRNDLVVRAGFGVFFDQINLNPFLDFRPPIAASQGIQGNAFGSSPVSTYSRSGYQWDVVQAGGKSIFPGVQACSDPNCAAATDPKGLSAYSVSPNFRVPYFYNYNLQVEKGFGNAVVWQIGYVGSEGRKLNLVSNINQPNPTTGAIPFPNFGNILQLNTIGTSNYNALQTVLRVRAWHGLTSQFAYTWSHALDEISEYRATVVDNAYNPKADYGNGDFDTRHLFTIDFTYDVPKAPWASSGWSKHVFNDWQVSSVMNWHSGQPYDEILSYLNVVGDPFASGNGVTVDHKFVKGVGTLWVNPTAFCDPNAINPATNLPDPVCRGISASLYGNISRNKWHAPAYGDVDLSFIKNIRITERVKLQLRADFFNLLNRINLSSGVGALPAFGTASPNGDVCSQNFTTHRCSADFGTSGFGLVTDTIGDFNGAPAIGPGEARNIQLVGKIIF